MLYRLRIQFQSLFTLLLLMAQNVKKTCMDDKLKVQQELQEEKGQAAALKCSVAPGSASVWAFYEKLLGDGVPESRGALTRGRRRHPRACGERRVSGKREAPLHQK